MTEYINYRDMFASADENKIYARTTWLVTFADLLSLLLVFFILMYATSTIQKDKLKGVIDSLETKFNSKKIVKELNAKPSLNAGKTASIRGADLDYLYAILESRIKGDVFLSSAITVSNNANSLIITMNNKDIFGGNTPVLSANSESVIFAIGEALQKVNNKIEIITYNEAKDSMPKSWDLSMLRAVVIASELRKMGNSSVLEARVSLNKEPEKQSEIKIIIHEFVD